MILFCFDTANVDKYFLYQNISYSFLKVFCEITNISRCVTEKLEGGGVCKEHLITYFNAI